MTGMVSRPSRQEKMTARTLTRVSRGGVLVERIPGPLELVGGLRWVRVQDAFASGYSVLIVPFPSTKQQSQPHKRKDTERNCTLTLSRLLRELRVYARADGAFCWRLQQVLCEVCGQLRRSAGRLDAG